MPCKTVDDAVSLVLQWRAMQQHVGLDEQIEVIGHRTQVGGRCWTALLIAVGHQFERRLSDGSGHFAVCPQEVFIRAVAKVEHRVFSPLAVELQQCILAVEVEPQLLLNVVYRQIFHIPFLYCF
jgi:hypothetical protein